MARILLVIEETDLAHVEFDPRSVARLSYKLGKDGKPYAITTTKDAEGNVVGSTHTPVTEAELITRIGEEMVKVPAPWPPPAKPKVVMAKKIVKKVVKKEAKPASMWSYLGL